MGECTINIKFSAQGLWGEYIQAIARSWASNLKRQKLFLTSESTGRLGTEKSFS